MFPWDFNPFNPFNQLGPEIIRSINWTAIIAIELAVILAAGAIYYLFVREKD